MKNLIIVCTAVVFAISFVVEAEAQEESRVGLKGGLGLYSTTASVSFSGLSAEETSDSRVGFAAGLFIEKPFSDIVSGQIEALYVQKGGKDKVSDEDIDEDFEIDAGDGDLTLSYIDVPVMLKINIPIESDIGPFVYGGGFAGYLLDATVKADGESIDAIEIKDLLTDLNYGLIFGAGVNFGAVSFDIRYDLGLANIFDKDSNLFSDLEDEFGDEEGFEELEEILDGIEISTSGFMFTVGYMF